MDSGLAGGRVEAGSALTEGRRWLPVVGFQLCSEAIPRPFVTVVKLQQLYPGLRAPVGG